MGELRRVERIEDGAKGWLQDYAIHPDWDLSLKLLAHWRVYSKWDQEDFGVPEAAYYTAAGHWVEAIE